MYFDPKPADRRRHILTLAGVVSVALVFATPSYSQDDADVDLKPADFVPDEPIAIRVDDLKPSDGGSEVSVTVLNRTKEEVEQVVECTLYDADREDLGIAESRTVKVGPEKRVSATVNGAEGAKFAECLVRAAK